MSKKTVLEMVEFHQPQPVCNRMQARIRLRDNVGLRRGTRQRLLRMGRGPRTRRPNASGCGSDVDRARSRG